MIRLWLIFATLVFSVLFLAFEPGIGRIGFPFNPMVLSVQNWVFFFFEHVNAWVIAVVLSLCETKYKIAVRAYVGIQLLDIVDYVLTYNEPWFDWMPSYNTIKVGIFGLAFLYEAIKHGRTTETS